VGDLASYDSVKLNNRQDISKLGVQASKFKAPDKWDSNEVN
jgi:hypothetical protein